MPSQDNDRKDKSPSDPSPTIGHISHTLTASMSRTDYTFNVILKNLVGSATGNRKTAFCLRVPLTRGTNQPSTSDADQAVIPAVTAMTNTTQLKQEPDLSLLLLLLLPAPLHLLASLGILPE